MSDEETVIINFSFSYAIVRDMTAAGLGLNKFCYAGLISAFKNKKPTTEETTTKVCNLFCLLLLFTSEHIIICKSLFC